MRGLAARRGSSTFSTPHLIVKAMIKNLLLIALRNLRKDKWYSLINVLGLTIGTTFSLFLIFYITDELSYDRYQKNAERIYRIILIYTREIKILTGLYRNCHWDLN